MNQPLITVVIPTYKRPQLLRRAVRSVLAQSYQHFEILIADNASGEETTAVVQKLMQQDNRIKILKHSSNIGPIANFQSGFEQVTTPYFSILSDDDFYLPHFFEKTLAMFFQYPDIALCSGINLWIDQKYTITSAIDRTPIMPPSGYYAPPRLIFTYLGLSCRLLIQSVLFKTASVKELGGFDIHQPYYADVDLIGKCIMRFPVYLITDQALVVFYQNPGSNGSTIDFFKDEKDRLRLSKNLLSLTSDAEIKKELSELLQSQYVKLLSNAYRDFCSAKDFANARICAKKICAIKHSKKWQRKQREALLYTYLPFLFSLYIKLKEYKTFIMRCVKPQQSKEESPLTQLVLHQEAAKWKEYTLNLEKHE